jgi:hypothetical protein
MYSIYHRQCASIAPASIIIGDARAGWGEHFRYSETVEWDIQILAVSVHLTHLLFSARFIVTTAQSNATLRNDPIFCDDFDQIFGSLHCSTGEGDRSLLMVEVRRAIRLNFFSTNICPKFLEFCAALVRLPGHLLHLAAFFASRSKAVSAVISPPLMETPTLLQANKCLVCQTEARRVCWSSESNYSKGGSSLPPGVHDRRRSPI